MKYRIIDCVASILKLKFAKLYLIYVWNVLIHSKIYKKSIRKSKI